MFPLLVPFIFIKTLYSKARQRLKISSFHKMSVKGLYIIFLQCFIEQKYMMKPKQDLSTRSQTRLNKYRLPFSKATTRKQLKQLSNPSIEISTPAPTFPYKPHLSIRSLKTHRKSTTVNNRSIFHELQSPRQPQKLIKTITLFNCFHVTLSINNEEVNFKSHATSVGSLLQQIKKAFIRRNNCQPFVLQSQDNNLALNYYLTIPSSKTNPFFGKTLQLKPYLVSSQAKVDVRSFHVLKCIGSGGFSKVFLARFKGNGLFYAMKVISKSFISKHKKQKLVENQRKVMIEISHPLHAQLQWCFQSKNYLFLVMDYYPGGELFGLLKRNRRLKQSVAKFYVTQILLGLQKLHDSGIVYRDIKPQNILLDSQGHAHIADFGLAKPGLKSDDARAYSFCGSPEYMPPQIIQRKGHRFTADFYSLGALLYELVTGLPPFYSRDPQKIYNATLKQSVVHFAHFSSQLKNILESLLSKDQSKRLGSKYGVRQVLSHPWFGKVQTQDYLSKKVEAPVKFGNLEDISFENEQTSQKTESLLKIMQKQQIYQPFTPMFDNFNFNCQNLNGLKQKSRSSKIKPLGKCNWHESSSSSLRTKSSKVNNFL